MRLLLLALVVNVGGSAALARERDSDMTDSEIRKFLHKYGQCVVQRQQALASQAIALNVDNRDLLQRYGKLIDGDCLPERVGAVTQVRFKGDQYRYALADALVAKELAAIGKTSLDLVKMLDHRDPGLAPSRTSAKGKPVSEKKYKEAVRAYEQAQAYTYLSRFGECVVRVDPSAARALLLTDPETPTEIARFAAIGNALATCVPENKTMNFGKLALRGTIAVNYYRLVTAARSAGAGAAS